MTPEQFRTLGHEIVDWIADYREQIDKYPVMAQTEVGEVKASFDQSPPETGDGCASMLDQLNQKIMPGVSHWNHPNYFAYFPSNGDLSSVLGDMVGSGLSVIGLNWQSSPALTEMEELMGDWMRQMVGLSAAWKGVIQGSASEATLVSLLTAREKATEYGQNTGGLQAEESPLVVYTSTQSHSSVKKAALLAGFGMDNVRAIDVDDAFACRVDLLRRAIEADIAADRKPCAIVATVGTTSTTAIDPIAEIAQVAQEFGLWLHVDAAMAGSAMILPECRWMWEGVEAADSVVINAHKWLGAVFDCSIYFVQDVEHLNRVMSTNPSYLQTTADGEAINFRDWGIPLGRRFRALKLWCLIQDQGVSGLQARLRRDISHAQWIKEQIEAAEDWELIAPVPLQTVCVRHKPDGMTVEALNAHTLAWAERINRSGEAFVTPAKINGDWMVRISIGSQPTELEHVQALWQFMQQAVCS